MIKFENVEVIGFEAAIRGMRNPLNSWEKSDSHCCNCEDCIMIENEHEPAKECDNGELGFCIGENDFTLMMKLRNAGTDHRKFMRMITMYVDITAPLYWWKEFDTYKVGTVANSCSTMHKIAEKEFTLEDFSFEHLNDKSRSHLRWTIALLNDNRLGYIECVEKLKTNNFVDADLDSLDIKFKRDTYWWQMIQLLPSSYNQKRTVMMNYEVLANIYKSRLNHKLDEWVDLCYWIENLPYSELITGEV